MRLTDGIDTHPTENWEDVIPPVAPILFERAPGDHAGRVTLLAKGEPALGQLVDRRRRRRDGRVGCCPDGHRVGAEHLLCFALGAGAVFGA